MRLKLPWKQHKSEELTFSEDESIRIHERARLAKDLVNNPLLQELFEEQTTAYMEVFANTDPTNPQRSEDIHSRIVGLKEFRDYVHLQISNAEVLAMQLEQQEETTQHFNIH